VKFRDMLCVGCEKRTTRTCSDMQCVGCEENHTAICSDVKFVWSEENHTRRDHAVMCSALGVRRYKRL